jgi:hypothetical protein
VKFLHTIYWGTYVYWEVEHVPIDLVGHTFPTNMLVLKNQDIDVILSHPVFRRIPSANYMCA